MHGGLLITPNLNRRHRRPSPQGLGPHWGTHRPACEWAHIFFTFSQSCSLRALTGTHPVLRGMAQRPSVVRSRLRCLASRTLRHGKTSPTLISHRQSQDGAAGFQDQASKFQTQSVLFCEPKASVVHRGKQQHLV